MPRSDKGYIVMKKDLMIILDVPSLLCTVSTRRLRAKYWTARITVCYEVINTST